jgi:hypothetical protein
MLFMAERVAELAAISSRELPPLCAIAYVLDNAKTIASVMIETFMVILPCVAPLKSRRTAWVRPERLLGTASEMPWWRYCRRLCGVEDVAHGNKCTPMNYSVHSFLGYNNRIFETARSYRAFGQLAS